MCFVASMRFSFATIISSLTIEYVKINYDNTTKRLRFVKRITPSETSISTPLSVSPEINLEIHSLPEMSTSVKLYNDNYDDNTVIQLK